MAYIKHIFMRTKIPSLPSYNIRHVKTMIWCSKYLILDGIYPHIGLFIGLLADGNLHNIKLMLKYITNNGHPVKARLTFVGYILESSLTLRVIFYISFYI